MHMACAPRSGSDRSSGLINNLGLAPTNPTQKVKLEMARKLIADEQDAAASPRARSPKGTRSPKARLAPDIPRGGFILQKPWYGMAPPAIMAPPAES